MPGFVPSDYSVDFTRTRPSDNRNFDLRREFMGVADRAAIRVTSILNGAFMDILGAEMPIIQSSLRRVLYWHDADQPLDFARVGHRVPTVAGMQYMRDQFGGRGKLEPLDNARHPDLRWTSVAAMMRTRDEAHRRRSGQS